MVLLNKLLPNDGVGAPIGWENRDDPSPELLKPPPVGIDVWKDGVPPPIKPLPGVDDVENIEARKGFAAPAVPVICGRRPTPTVEAATPEFPKDEPPIAPVGWLLSPPNPVG